MNPSSEPTPSSEETIRRVIANSPDCVKVLDLEGRLLLMNASGQRLLGIANFTSRLGTRWTDWWEGDTRGDARAALEQAKQGGSGHFEAPAPVQGSPSRWWGIAISPVLGPDGQPERLLVVSRDITRTKQTEQRLIDTRARLAQAVEGERARLTEVLKHIPSFVAVFRGPEHVYEMVSDHYDQLIGQRKVLHKPVREAVPEVAGQGFFEILDRVYTTGTPFSGRDMRVLLKRQAGLPPEERFLDVTYQPLFTPEGTVSGILSHSVDMTARYAATTALAQTSEQRRVALDSAQLGWWHYDLASGNVRMDERFRAIFDLVDAELAHGTVRATVHPADRAIVDAALAGATQLDRPLPYTIEYRLIRPDGSMRWVQARGQANFEGEASERRAVSVIGTVMDTTEVKAARDALHASESRLRQLADAMPQIVWTARPDGVLDYTNHRWYEYIRRTEAEVSPADWHLRVHPDDLAGAAAAWAHSVASGNPYATEFRVRGGDNSYRWFLVRALAIREADGSIAHWYGTCTDIHDQRALHEQNAQLLASERAARSEAERTSRVKDEFLATLSHELRTPLNAILGWTQVLRGDPANSGDVEAGLATIERNARAQNEIIEDLLDMSRIISGKVRLDVQRIDLAAVVEAAVDTVRPAADAKGIRLQPVIDPQAGPVSGDPNRLQQVFWNLLSNAIKFTPKGGRVQVVLERVHSHLEVNVTDSGEGIAPEFLPHVFDRFRQADASTTRRHGGLGLGLAIVKQLVELHGGGVHVESPGLGQGTTFRVMLPLVAVQAADPVEGERRHPQTLASSPMSLVEGVQLVGVKVLVVDDEADARALVKRLLQDRGAVVQVAGSVAQALERLAAETPDVLISDIGMPGEDGYALIQKVRALPPGQGGGTPAIALTAYARSEDRMKAILAGFQMHLAKPVEAAELLVLVANLAGRMENA